MFYKTRVRGFSKNNYLPELSNTPKLPVYCGKPNKKSIFLIGATSRKELQPVIPLTATNQMSTVLTLENTLASGLICLKSPTARASSYKLTVSFTWVISKMGNPLMEG